MNETANRYVIDITTLIKWDRPPTGIIRTLYKVTKWFHDEKFHKDVVFVKFLDDKSSLSIVQEDELIFLLDKFKNNSFSKPYHEIAGSDNFIKNEILKKIMAYYKKYGLIFIVKKILFNAFPRVYCRLFSRGNILINKKDIIDQNSLCNIHLHDAFLQDSILKESDIFISVGLDWDYSNYELLYYLKKKIDFEFIGIIYDIIPLSHPHFTNSNRFSEIFFKHVYYLNYLADRIMTISEFSRKSFLSFRKEQNMSASPPVQTIYLGDNIENTDVELSSLPFKEFILYVSTIEPKKNQIVLLKAYQLAHINNIDLPPLILVGMYGNDIKEFHNLCKKYKNIKKKIIILSELNDNQLDYLYKNTLFCVYPSHIEGWGLGAAESLNYGKVCLVSSAEALKEATHGLMPVIDANDAKEWMNCIHYYSTNQHKRRELEDSIKQNYVRREWSEFCEKLYCFAQGITK